MSNKKPKLSVIEQTDSGRNKKFIDNDTKEIFTRAQLSNAIDAGKYPEHHVRKINDLRTPASNPNGKEEDNLG